MRYLAGITAFLAFALAGADRPAEHPTIDELLPLLSQPIESEAVQAVVKKYDLEKGAKGDSGSFRPRDNAYVLMFRENRISTVILQASPYPKGYGEPHWAPYAHALPRNLKPTDSRSDVVKKLGKPTPPGNDHWIDDKLDVWVFFGPKDAFIQELYVSAAKGKS